MAGTNEFMKRFFGENPVPEETIQHFSSVPWTNEYVQDKAYKAVPTYSRVLKPDGEDFFFSNTINTPATIPHYLTLMKIDYETLPITKPSQPNASGLPSHKQATEVPDKPDCIFLLNFGARGLDGHPGVIHGGVACALLDETMGLMIMLHHNNVATTGARDLLYTVNLNVNYRAQVPAPGEALVRTWLTKREERKWYSKGQIVDKDGKVLVEGDGLWLIVKSKL